jgi:hypothetical protein
MSVASHLFGLLINLANIDFPARWSDTHISQPTTLDYFLETALSRDETSSGASRTR